MLKIGSLFEQERGLDRAERRDRRVQADRAHDVTRDRPGHRRKVIASLGR